MSFKPGDTVKLKSGGPVMTVEQVGRDIVGTTVCLCKWFNGTELKASNFSPEILMPAAVPAESSVKTNR